MGFLDYVMAPIESNDKKLGIRPLMAIAALVGLIKYVETHVSPDSGVMNSFIMLIAILLGLSTTQNIADKAIASKAPQSNPAP